MTSGASSLDSSGSGPPSLSYPNNERGLSSTSRDHGGLKEQYEKAIKEVQVLRRQNSDMSRRCDHTTKELDYYRNQNRAVKNQLETTVQESSALRAKCGELVVENQRLEREIQNLQDMSTLQSQDQQEIMGHESNNCDSMNQLYLTLSRKYESIKDEYDSLRKRHDDFLASHSAAVNKLELAQEELARTKSEYEEIVKERNAAIKERNGLKQQCATAIMQWDIILRERDDCREALAKMQQQHDEAVKEINQAMNVRMKASKDLKRLTEERNAAMMEYTLIMSERDSVHKEMEKLTDDLSQEIKKNKTLLAQNKEYAEEKKVLSYQIETLKREIQSALHDRDKVLKECNDLREKFGEFTAKEESNQAYKSRTEFNLYCRERNNSRQDQAEVSSSTRDIYGKSQKERMENLDQANQELDILRKQIDKLQAELQEATQEAEVSKRRRDWAFSERDKIVMERESMRTLCDRLRKERDRAVSDLAEALRDSDDIKKQRNEASKELKELKEKMEAQLEKENRMQQFQSIGHNHSHDSAIDTDMQEWETEILDIDLTGITSDDDLGFDLVGGRDDPQYPNDAGIYVSSITEGSITDGKLKVNDCISRVNNLDCSNVSKRKVLETVRSSGGTASMVIRRRRVGARCLYTTQLQVHLNFEHGLTLETGIYISKINPESLAAKEGNLAVGDRILSINNKPMDGLKSAREAMAILDEAGDVITITAFKNMSGQNGSTEDDRGFGMRNQNVSPKEHGVEHRHCKTVNSSSQTDDRSFALSPSEEYMDRRYYEPKSKSREKSSGNSGTWKKIRDQFHSVTGPKSSSRDDKKHVRNMSPTGEAFDAIAELDSVIDTYHPKQTKRKEKGVEQNGGTWPKVRVGPIIQQGTGTIVHPRKTKVRSPLSDILPNNSINKYQTDFPKRSNPRPVSDFVPFAKSGQIMHSLSPRSFKEPSMEFERNPDRHTLSVLAPSDGSIDLSVKSGNGGKDIMDYYKWKNNRYPVSDSESNMSPLEGSLPPHVRGHSQLYPSSGLRSLPHYPFPHHPHPHISSRYPSPTHIPFTHSGDSIGGYSGGFEPSRTPPQQPFHTHSPSVDYPKSLSLPSGHNHQQYRVDDNMPPVVSPLMPGHEVGTYPRKKENQRIRIPNLVMRIPSNPNVINSNKVSTGSIERTSERGSPMPPYYTFEVINPGRDNKRNSLPDYYCSPNKVALGEIRKVEIDKSIIRYQSELLGIQIRCPKEGGGIFISSVTENSIASKVGLLIGHQLLDVCGVNLRNATYELAAKVLQQCGNNDDSITMLVQYNPDKYHEVEASPSTSDDESHSRSDSPTPCNSPKTSRKSAAESSNLRGTYARSTLTRNQISPVVSTLTKQNAAARSSGENTKSIHEARYVCIETKKCSNLGISLVGGNAVGIFVHSVQVDSSAYNAGLRTGDQILECRGVDLRHATAEEAAYELAKPADKVTILALCNIDRYNEVKDKPGDSFYIRALFDRLEINDSSQLKFHKDDILYVDNTMYDQVPGYWSAWLVDEDGNKKKNGIIPSKYKVEEDMLRRSMGDLESDSRRGTTTARRSFFRRKKHQRSSSRDSKELASFISTMNWYSDSGALNEETALSSYQRVERLDYPTYRPVIIIGPFSDCVIDKLIQEYPNKFSRHVPQTMTCSQSTIDKGVAEKKIIDYRKKGNYFEYTTVAAVKDLCDKNSHCILDVNLSAVERLHKHQIYPVVLLMKFKSTKQIKEVKDIRFATDKVSAKAAKEMYEHALKLESEYKNCISVVIQITGVNIAYMCTQIKTVVDEEQNKTLWVPFTNS